MQRTFVMIKPDGVQRGLVGTIIARLERKGLQLVACRLLQPSQELARAHYAVHEERPFFEDLIRFITSGPVVAMVWQGDDAVAVVRRLLGTTDGREAAPGTIRGDFGLSVSNNLVHGSDSPETAAEEMARFFPEDELVDYERELDAWVYES